MHFELVKHPKDNINLFASTPLVPTSQKALLADLLDKGDDGKGCPL
jgi:hypothetical protein